MMLASLLLIALQSPVAPPAAPPAAPTKATEKLIELRALLDDNQCDKVVALSPYVEDHRLATQAERHEAMFARAYCLISSLGNIAEAGAVLHEILAEDIKANPPFDVEPKFQFLVDGARANLTETRRAKAEAEHARKIARIAFEVSASPNVKGGNRVFFDARLTDPDDVVRSMRVNFRRKGEREYYALPVTKKDDGWWRGEVPGTYTKSSQGVTLEWFLTLSDDDGEPLKSAGTRDAPYTLEVLPGSAIAEDLEAKERVPQPTRFVAGIAISPFFTVVGVAAGVFLSVGIAGGLGFIDDGFANVVGGLAMLSMPIGLGSGMVFLNASTILDAPDSWLATGVVAGALFFGEICLLADWVIHRRSAAFAVGRDFSRESTRSGPPIAVDDGQLLVAGAGFVIIGALAGAVTTPVLVGLDAPE